ncbi:hypothetical protein SHK09_08185 [Polaribacter sp. PL03]|uniref:hypothetical protein n=1 Tax=Polaribacter sp. PL03 TaxID=3088353 RepID=UPI0029CE2D2B|nr:hypothetical protein [Polaribacter sp. PL03]MDX6746767.1 hypothetical protein [Polaribacter sp. PL03]
MNSTITAQLINKEQIVFLKFPKEEVLDKKEAIKNRCADLKRAMALGNLERGKVNILFKDNLGLKRVETTIWGVTDVAVILKKRTIIPLRRIISIA